MTSWNHIYTLPKACNILQLQKNEYINESKIYKMFLCRVKIKMKNLLVIYTEKLHCTAPTTSNCIVQLNSKPSLLSVTLDGVI